MRSLGMNGKDKTVGIHLLSLYKGTENRETQTEDLLCERHQEHPTQCFTTASKMAQLS